MACKRSTIFKDYIVKQNNNSSFGNERTAGGLLLAVGDRAERQDRYKIIEEKQAQIKKIKDKYVNMEARMQKKFKEHNRDKMEKLRKLN